MGLIDNDFLNSIATDNMSNAAAEKGTLTIRVDGDAFLFCDGEYMDVELKANKIVKVELVQGQHVLQFTCAEDEAVVEERIVDIEPGKSQLLMIKGLAPKSKEEKLADNIEKFKKEIQKRLDDDNRIDAQEAAELEEIRRNLSIDPKTSLMLINDARRKVRSKQRTVSDSKAFSIEVLCDSIAKNDVQKIRTFLPDLASALEAVSPDSIEGGTMNHLYYMCLAALNPNMLIKVHESSYVDNYWRTYWAFIAYSRNKQRAKVADTLADLEDIYLDYPDDNTYLLRVIDALNNLGKQEAIDLFKAYIEGNYSVQLSSLAKAVRFELGLEKPASRQEEQECEFIQEQIVSFEDLSVRRTRIEKEKEEARKKIKYTLSITKINDKILALMTARTAFGWSSSESRQKLENLPVQVLVTDDKQKAMSLYEQFTAGGMEVQVAGVNALGEQVAVKTLLSRECFVPVKKDGKYGFVDKSGKLVVPCMYDDAHKFSEGMATVEQDGKYGFVDKSGKLFIPCMYDWAKDFSEGMAAVKQDGKYGFVDKSGKLVVPCMYDDAYAFSEGLAAVKQNGKYGFIDKSGKLVVPCIYEKNSFLRFAFREMNFHEGMAKVQQDGKKKYGFIDKSGKLVVPCMYDWADDFREGLAAVIQDDKCGFIDKYGKLVVPCIYHICGFRIFHDGMAAVKQDGKWGFIDKSGKLVVPYTYDEAKNFSEGLAAVKQNGKCGFIDKSGKFVIQCTYDNAYNFSEGMAAVKQDGKWGFIDKSGKFVVQCTYDNADNFSEGMAEVMRGSKYGFIDKSGKLVIPCTYDNKNVDLI